MPCAIADMFGFVKDMLLDYIFCCSSFRQCPTHFDCFCLTTSERGRLHVDNCIKDRPFVGNIER